MRVGFTCGTYDLFHAGHVLALLAAKAKCDYLIVGLQTDPSIDRPEKNKPVQTLEERLVQLRGCRYVDKVWVYTTEIELLRYLSSNSDGINVRFLGADWEGKEYTGKKLDMECVFTPRDHTYSSSSLRDRIYDAEFLKRNTK